MQAVKCQSVSAALPARSAVFGTGEQRRGLIIAVAGCIRSTSDGWTARTVL
jgi:hypothetical protein